MYKSGQAPDALLSPATMQPLITAIILAATFFSGWIYAVVNWGWFLGLAFGWLPAALIAAMAGCLAYFLWPLALFGLILIAAYVVVLYPIALVLIGVVAIGAIWAWISEHHLEHEYYEHMEQLDQFRGDERR